MRAAVLLVFAIATRAHADASVEIRLNDLGEDLAMRLGLSVPELIAHAEGRIEELYKLQRLDELLRSFADTAAFAHRGVSVDYDVDPGDILIGAAAGVMHSDVAFGTENELLGGSTINAGLIAGANLIKRWTFFANGFYQKTALYGLEGHLLTLGTHAQYTILPARDAWTGLAATSGLEYSRWSIGNTSTVESGFRAQGVTEYASIHMSSTGTLSVVTSTVTVPLELSTGVRAWRVLAFYVAAGVDLTAGSSTIEAQLDSVLSINADHLPIGTAVITGSGESSPSPVSVHALGGFAIHTRHARIFMQGIVAPGEVGANLGLRMAL